MQIWTNKEKGNEKIIAYIDQTIYRGNPKSSEIDACIYELKMRKIPADSFVGIPLHYLKEINIQEGKDYIEILFGSESYEHFRIKDLTRRTEIFDFFKANIPNAAYSVHKYSKLKAGKKPLIAMAVIGLIFLWVFIIAKGMESGTSYEVVGEQHSLASIVLLVASLGVNKILLIFASLFAIAVVAFIKKAKNPPIISRLTITR